MGADFLRRMDWLGRGRTLGYLRLLALLNVATLVLLIATSHHGVDRNGFLLGSDFISFWTVGRMLGAHADVYDTALHITWQQAFFASPQGYTAFFYPPVFLPFCRPLGLLGYFPALGLWLATTAALYLGAVKAWMRHLWAAQPIRAPLWLVFLAYPAALIVITHGQTAFLVAALLGLGLWWVPTRPTIAGILLGLAIIKPQLGLLVPIALVFAREWKTLAAATLCALALAATVTLAFGGDIWTNWASARANARHAMQAGAVPYGKMTSVFATLRLLGVGTSPAYLVQAMAAIVVIGMVALCAWKRGLAPVTAALVLAGAGLVTPFVLDYDMVILAFPLVWLTAQGLATGWRDWEKLAVLLAFVAPAFARPLALSTNVSVMPLVLALLFAAIWGRSKDAQPSHSAIAER